MKCDDQVLLELLDDVETADEESVALQEILRRDLTTGAAIGLLVFFAFADNNIDNVNQAKIDDVDKQLRVNNFLDSFAYVVFMQGHGISFLGNNLITIVARKTQRSTQSPNLLHRSAGHTIGDMFQDRLSGTDR